jgi:multidrug transporter EmrE-like cation transporter
VSSSSIVIIGIFCAMQVIAQLLFKWGSLSDGRWLWGFLGGNLFGFTSIWLLMLVYKHMNPNTALGICGGASFLLAQLALAVVFRSQVSWVQWAGVVAIVAGMVLLASGKPANL